ncbi:MAG: DUF4293 domain-containing protein [bacterium]|nr:DUF4293 domain-containing protein [bacterium]
MLQRIQTYYLGIIIIIQVVAISGMDFIRFYSEKYVYTLNAWGVSINPSDKVQYFSTSSGYMVPVFIGFISLALLAFLCIMSYKNLDRQLKLGRTLFYLYFVSVVSVYLMAAFGDRWIDEGVKSQEVGLPYWLFICGLPFAFLANTGIKRDKRILDSLKRL